MSRSLLGVESYSPAAASALASFHPTVISEVSSAVSKNKVVVVGMGWNPHCKKARKTLEKAGIAHEYLEYGNYLSKWRERLAIKMWSGWPTFPQVFINGKLVGGASDLQKGLEDGSLKTLLG